MNEGRPLRTPFLFLVGCADAYRENGNISHAIPRPIARNSASDQSACRILPAIVCRPRHAKATETHSAKVIIAAKWLKWMPVPGIQDFRPQAIR
jgi:hypothetical protein